MALVSVMRKLYDRRSIQGILSLSNHKCERSLLLVRKRHARGRTTMGASRPAPSSWAALPLVTAISR